MENAMEKEEDDESNRVRYNGSGRICRCLEKEKMRLVIL